MTSISTSIESIQTMSSLEQRITLFSYVQHLSYQINGCSKPEEVINSGAGYCVSKHRLLKELFKEIGIESHLCYVSFSFGNVWLPKHLQEWGMATKDWYHAFLQAKIEGKIIYVDASFPISFSGIYSTSKERDGMHSMIPFGGPYETIIVCHSKEDERSAKKECTKNTLLDSNDEKRIDEFNSRSLSVSKKYT